MGLNKGGKVCAHHNYNTTKIQFLFFAWPFLLKIQKAELNFVSLPKYLNFTNFYIYTTNFLFFSKCWWDMELISVKPVRKDWLFWAKIDLLSLLSLIIKPMNDAYCLGQRYPFRLFCVYSFTRLFDCVCFRFFCPFSCFLVFLFSFYFCFRTFV